MKTDDTKRSRLWRWWERAGIFLLLGLLVAAAAATNPDFRRPSNLANILAQAVPAGIAAIGMTVAIAGGVFDLSVGSMMGLTACVFVGLTGRIGFLPALLASAALGFVLGLANGLIVTRARITPFIATLGTMWVFRSFSYLYTRNQPLQFDHPWADALGGSILGIPILFVLMAVLYAAGYVLLYRTPFGRCVFAVGSNRRAAVLSGIDSARIMLFTFALLGFSAALAGAALAVRLASAKADTALGYELTVIATVVLGGTSLKGGTGTLTGTFGAAMLFAVIYNAMDMYELQSFYQKIALGGVLLLALAIDGLRRRWTET
jgi:ribose transport system permease protein